MRSFLLLGVVLGSFLTGCSDLKNRWTDRYGPEAVPNVAKIDEASGREADVVAALAKNTGFSTETALRRDDWFLITWSGFNTVDDACYQYIDDLWKLDRDKSRNANLLSATGAAIAGIIAVQPHPSAATLGILAQSFGLASALNNTIAESYLYSQSAASIHKLVSKTMKAYRDEFNKNRTVTSYPMEGSAFVYSNLREYVSLCLPPVIQAQIDNVLANATTVVPNSTTPTTTTTTTTKSGQNGGATSSTVTAKTGNVSAATINVQVK